MRAIVLAFCLLAAAAVAAQPAGWRSATPEEQRADAAAFAGFDQGIGERLPDVESVVVVIGGRTAYAYHRDGDPEALRDTQSVAKTALATLVGVALRQGQLAALDRPVVELVPQWRTLNADPRAQAITLAHLLSMKAGFAVDDASGTAAPLPPEQAWARPLRAAPGETFAYDNSVPVLIAAVLEKVTGQRVADYARAQLVKPLDMREPSYERGLQLRTVDMAKIGYLYLRDGHWQGQPLLPAGFVADATRPRSAGGAPVNLPYALGWWVPSPSTFFASGHGGQFIWVHPPLDLVVAVTSTVSPGSQQRGEAMQLIRGRLFEAARQRVAAQAK